MSVFSTKTKSFTAALAAAAALVAGTPAFAETFVSNGRSVEVRHGYLDLNNAEGRRALNARIYKTATKVCATADAREMMACREKTLNHIKQPISAAIARAETKARYADATPASARVVVGN